MACVGNAAQGEGMGEATQAREGMNLKLAKWEGLGNDYLVLEEEALPGPLTPQAVANLCDRHLGVGADGVLLKCAPSGAVPGAVSRMRVFNPDGSESEMCGNGIRIFARYLVQRRQVHNDEFLVETLAGPIRPRLLADGRVRVDMGWARFVSDSIDVTWFGGEYPVIGAELTAGDERLRFTFVDVGNPHCVILVDDPASVDIARLGPLVEHHRAFPRRVNVEFVRVEADGTVTMRVWERGVGETQACGTGATAVGAACVRLGLVSSPVTVHLPGGDLVIEVEEGATLDDTRGTGNMSGAEGAGSRPGNAGGGPPSEALPSLKVHMTGPAEEVFCCELAPALLRRLGWATRDVS